MNNISKCPRCGGMPVLSNYGRPGSTDCYRIECNNCLFAGPSNQSSESAVLEWESVAELVNGAKAEKARSKTVEGLVARVEYLEGRINSPEYDEFLRGVRIEALHQVERWGTEHDKAQRPADWFWLVGYLAGKALHAALQGHARKARHHCISTAAALYNWHCAISGTDVRMCPGRSDLADLVEGDK